MYIIAFPVGSCLEAMGWPLVVSPGNLSKLVCIVMCNAAIAGLWVKCQDCT